MVGNHLGLRLNNMETKEIAEIIVHEENGIKTLEGGFMSSGGVFSVRIEGDGNAQRNEITLWGNQYSMDDEQTKIVIYGEWEIREVAELLNIVANT
jgi:hypothetical protein